MSEETIQHKMDEKFGVNEDAALETFRKGFSGHSDISALFVDNSTLTTDNLMILDVLAKKSKTPAYRGFFAYELLLFGSIPATHTDGDLPFFFNNMACIDYMIAGDESCVVLKKNVCCPTFQQAVTRTAESSLYKSLFAKLFCQSVPASFAPTQPHAAPKMAPPRMSVG